MRCTVASAFIDVRSGYVYGLTEQSAEASELTSVWRTKAATDSARASAERLALDAFLPELKKTWNDIRSQYATK